MYALAWAGIYWKHSGRAGSERSKYIDSGCRCGGQSLQIVKPAVEICNGCSTLAEIGIAPWWRRLAGYEAVFFDRKRRRDRNERKESEKKSGWCEIHIDETAFLRERNLRKMLLLQDICPIPDAFSVGNPELLFRHADSCLTLARYIVFEPCASL